MPPPPPLQTRKKACRRPLRLITMKGATRKSTPTRVFAREAHRGVDVVERVECWPWMSFRKEHL